MQLFDAIADVFRARLLLELFDAAILQDFVVSQPSALVAQKQGLNQNILEGVMRFLATDPSLVECNASGSFRLLLCHDEIVLIRAHIRKFFDAYGPCLKRVPFILRGAESGDSRMDKSALADAFLLLPAEAGPITDAVADTRARSIVELGCGTGAQLVCLGNRLPQATLIGIDANPEMCRAAEKRVSEAGLSGRIQIIESDAGEVLTTLPDSIRQSVDVIYGKSILNSQFNRGCESARGFLRKLVKAFPLRKFICVDYYGELMADNFITTTHTQGLLQDIVQLLSDQGTPLADVHAMAGLYDSADCRLELAQHGVSEGIRWFIHHIRLGEVIDS